MHPRKHEGSNKASGKAEAFSLWHFEFKLQFLFWMDHWASGTVHTFNQIEQKNGHLAQVDIDEGFSLTCLIITEVPPNNAVPGGV